MEKVAQRAVDVSVLLPVHNAGPYLLPALASLERQEGVAFEVIAVDDGSTDGSRAALVAAARTFPALRVLTQDQAGIATALNRAWVASRGAFIARMDADDIAAPDRLLCQLQYMRSASDTGVCGSWFRRIGVDGARVVRVPITDAAIRARLVFGSAFAHPAVMLRRSALPPSPDLYQPAAEVEDYELWLRLAKITHFHNLPAVLLDYRCHPQQFTRRPRSRPRACLEALRLRLLAEHGLIADEAAAAIHAATGFEAAVNEVVELGAARAWLRRLADTLPRAGWSGPREIADECAAAWWRLNRRQARGVRAALAYWEGSGPRWSPREVVRTLRLACRRGDAAQRRV